MNDKMPKRRVATRALWRAGLFALAVGTAGCGAKEPDAAAGGEPVPLLGGTLRVAHQEPGTLDPLYVDDVYEATITNQIYDGLVRLDETCNLRPQLATTWTVSPDGKEYVFTLASPVRFSDGSPLTSLDVAVTLASILSPQKTGVTYAQTYMLAIEGARDFLEGRAPWPKGLQAPDPRTVRVVLEQPMWTFLSALTMDQTRVVPWRERIGLIRGGLDALEPFVAPGVVAAARGESPPAHRLGIGIPGSGPYALVEWAPEDHVTLVRNPHYAHSTVGVDTLLFLCRESWEGDAVVDLFRRREVEVAPVPRGRREDLEGEAEARIEVSHELSLSFIGLKVDHPPFDEPLYRRAVAHAVDVSRLAALDPDIAEAAGGILPPGMPGYSPTPQRLPYDPQSSRDALAALGYGPGNPAPPCTMYTTPSSDPRDEFEAILVENLADVGIRMEVAYIDWTVLDRLITERALGMFSFGWVADLPDPDSFYHFLFHSDGDNNVFGFSDPEVDRLIEAARTTRPPERWDIYRRLEGMILQEAPIIPLRNTAQLTAWQPYVSGIRQSPLGLAMMSFEQVRLVRVGRDMKAQLQDGTP
jgi:ABC-type transport system substrate-binding protein